MGTWKTRALRLGRDVAAHLGQAIWEDTQRLFWGAINNPVKAALVCFAALGLSTCYAQQRLQLKQEVLKAKLATIQQHWLNDSLSVKLTQEQLGRHQADELLAAERATNGKLVAAIKLHLAQRDTVIVHDTLPTTVRADGSRTATFRDSTFAGFVQATITAPLFPAPLRLDSMRITRPAFSPSVGLLNVGGNLVAVVNWRGEHAEIVTAYTAPAIQPQRARWLVPYVAGGVSLGSGWNGQVGADLRLPKLPDRLRFTGTVSQEFTAGKEPARLHLNARWDF